MSDPGTAAAGSGGAAQGADRNGDGARPNAALFGSSSTAEIERGRLGRQCRVLRVRPSGISYREATPALRVEADDLEHLLRDDAG